MEWWWVYGAVLFVVSGLLVMLRLREARQITRLAERFLAQFVAQDSFVRLEQFSFPEREAQETVIWVRRGNLIEKIKITETEGGPSAAFPLDRFFAVHRPERIGYEVVGMVGEFPKRYPQLRFHWVNCDHQYVTRGP